MRICLFFLFPPLLFSLPSLSRVSIGQAEVSLRDGEIAVSADHNSLLDWDHFSLAVDEKARFSLPSSDSIVINRVIGDTSSQIFGHLSSNGKVVLINPHGIYFGQNSSIQMTSFIASTLHLNENLFKTTKTLEFEEKTNGSIVHSGTIEVEKDLFFLANQIEHSGEIFARSSVGFFALEKWDLNSSIDSFQRLSRASQIKASGPIHAPGASLSLAAESIDLFSLIDVSHPKSPGTISVSDKSLITTVHESASLAADALECGKGGKIFIFGLEMARMKGSLSAEGGPLGGDGGLLEISTHKELDFTGNVSTLAPLGEPGTLMIDPLDLTVAAANVNVTGATPFTPTGAGATLNAATVIAALASTNVVITTLGTPTAGLGDITVNSPITWSAGTSLTISAANDIFVNRNIQQDTALTGGVVLNAVRDVTVSGAAASTSVGSQNATTSVIAGRNVTVQGGAARIAQIGFYTPGGGTSQGPINVSCVDLTLRGGTGVDAGVQIGHGRINVSGLVLSTTPTANITINATGNILMRNAVSNTSFVAIGHGGRTVVTGSSENGDIRITCGNNLTMDATFGGGNSSLSIGHLSPIITANPGASFSGLIDVRVQNNLTLRGSDVVSGAGVMIGHGGQASGTNANSISGDIIVCCGIDATLTAGLVGPARIGHIARNAAPFPITGNISISIGRDLNMTGTAVGGTASPCIIGFIETAIPASLTQILNLSVCRNSNFATTAISNNTLGVGLRSSTGTTPSEVNFVTGGNLTAPNLSSVFQIVCRGGDLNLAVGGDLTAFMGNINGGSILAGATLPLTGTLRIYTGGDLFANGSALGGTFNIGTSAVFQPTSVDVRAGGDITWPSTFVAPIPAPISIQAGYSFAAGEIWNGNGSQITSICSQPLSPLFSLLCGPCSALVTASPAITALCGSFTLSPNGVTNVNLSTSGALTLASQCTACSGSPSSLLIGPGAANDITLTGTIGPIQISAFESIQINGNITSSSSIFIASCGDLTLNPNFNITSTGAGSPITLISDVDNSGAGNLNLLGGNITSNNGNICLAAAPGTFGCSTNNCLTSIPGLISGATSSVNQTNGIVSSGSGSTTVTASGNILIDGSATSISTTSGPVALNAGANLTINENITSTAGTITSISDQNTTINDAIISAFGEIRMLAGINMSLNGSTSIASTNNSVTLVVDNQFPFQPLIGPGAFTLSCASQITSGPGQPVRIFTALQGSNTFCATAQINSTPIGSLVGGTLFQNTPYEVWCTYFACPSPYPAPSLGFPFTVFYKDCRQLILEQATVVVDEFLVDLHPYDEFPGWKMEFWVKYAYTERMLQDEPYILRRKHLNLLNHPKSYTVKH